MDDGSRLPLEEGHVKKKSGIFDKLTHIFHGKQQDAVKIPRMYTQKKNGNTNSREKRIGV